MDFLKQILDDHGSALAAGVADKVGLSADKAQQFVPEAASSVFDVLKNKADGLDLSDIGGTASSLIDGVDVGGLADKVGIGRDEATSGLQSMVPDLLSSIQDKAGALGGLQAIKGLLQGDGLTDALGGVGNLAGKLFGKS